LRGRTVRPEDGLILLREGLDLARSSENRWAEAQILVELGRLRGERGDVDGGLLAAGQAVSLFTRMGARDQEWSARLVHGRLLERAGRIEDAAAAYRAALEALDEVRSKIGLPLLRSRYTPRSRLVYEALLQLEARRPGADDAAATTFEIAEQYRARTFTEMLIASRDTNLAGDSALRDEERTVRGKINALRTRLTRFPATVADRESVENELRDAERRHETLQVELQHTEPRYRPEPARVLSTPANAQALLGAGDRLVAYHLGEHGSLAWTLEDDRVALTKLPGRAQIENLVLVFRSLGVHRNDPAALRRVSRRLYDLLLAPLAERIEGGRSLVVIPDGALFYLPFEALRPPAADGRERFLLHDFSVSYIPSVAALAELRERRRPAAELDLLAFGDPTSQDPAMEPRLTHSGSEVRRISMLFDPSRSARLTGPEARESVFRDRARAPTTIVHLATHGVLDGGRPERSGLVFAPEDDPQGDGFLGLFEIFDLTVSADLVVLSGCDTARGELLRGEGILGLTRGFLFAGSRSVLASLWRVDDRSTEELMVTFYGHLARGHTTSQALRRAKLDWLAAAGGQAADPYAWASFVLVGDGDLTIPGLAPRRRTSVVLIVVGVVLLLVAFVAGRGGTGRRISLP
jgi:CHAT domain-containing protein